MFNHPGVLLVLGALVLPGALIWLVALGDRALSPLARVRMQPWVWITPATALIGAVLVYPAVRSAVSSLQDARGHFVGLANYRWMFTDEALRSVLRNNLTWLVIFPVLSVGVALSVALLSDRVGWERIARTAFLLPTAISFAVTGVIWSLMYQWSPPNQRQRGTLNGVLDALGFEPKPFVIDRSTNNLALIFAGVWAHVGLATVILAAAVKAIPRDVVEAARIDGAREYQIIMRIVIPLLWPTILVVTTTQVIYALKIFDIVYVMTNGNYGTDVIANQVYTQLFTASHFGRASALSIALFVLASPIIVFNLRQFRRSGR